MKPLLVFVVSVVALAAAVPALAKEGVKATLQSAVPLDAPAGTPLRISWTLSSVVEDGRRQPFGASGLFVRLVSASGAAGGTAFARKTEGSYTATVKVPKGGIGDIEFGLQGFTSGAAGSHRADVLFPITNDPIVTPRTVHSSSGIPTWIYALAVGLLAAAALVSISRRRLTALTTQRARQ